MPGKDTEVLAIDDIDYVSPDSVHSCLKELKSGANFLSFGWCEPKLGEASSEVEEICALITKSKKLKALDLENTGISDAVVEQLCEALKPNKSLQVLVLSNNDLGAKSAKAIDDMLKLNKTLKKIILTGNTRMPAHVVESIQSQLDGR